MNYGQPLRSGVTMIDELPELNDVESEGVQRPRPSPHPSGYQLAHNPHVGENLPPEAADKYRRIIRHRHVPDRMAGMMSYNDQNEQIHPHMAEHYEEQPPQPTYNPALNDISCLGVSSHVKDCPICSKLYNCDKTIYIIVIVVLAIIVLLLLKKVLDV